MLTVQGHLDLMRHALGKIPSSRHVLLDTYNRAGRALFTAHPWSWREVGPVELPAVANQDYIDLPLDFGGVRTCTLPGPSTLGVVMTTVSEIMNLRASLDTVGGFGARIWVAFPQWKRPANHTSQVTPRALIYPTPLTDGSPTLSVIYDCRWPEFTSTQLDQQPPLPDDFEQALIYIARGYACQIEDGRPTSDLDAYAAELNRLIAEDGGRQASTGRMRGGADRFLAPDGEPTYGTGYPGRIVI